MTVTELRVLIEEPLCDASTYLGNLQAVRETIVDRNPLGRTRDLRDSNQPHKLGTIEDAIPVLARGATAILGRVERSIP